MILNVDHAQPQPQRPADDLTSTYACTHTPTHTHTQTISLELPLGANVVPPGVSSDKVQKATISARTVAGEVGPVPVDLQPKAPTFLNCQVTVGGVAGSEALADELRAASALLLSVRARMGARKGAEGGQSSGKQGRRSSLKENVQNADGGAGDDVKREALVRLERRVKRLRDRLLRILGGVGDTAGTGVNQEEGFEVEVKVTWSHTHAIKPSYSVLVYVPGLMLEIERTVEGEAVDMGSGGSGDVSMAFQGGIHTTISRTAEDEFDVSGRQWVENVRARSSRAGVLLLISLKDTIPANVQATVEIKGSAAAKLLVDPHVARDAAAARLAASSTTPDIRGKISGMACPCARIGLLMSATTGRWQDDMEATVTSIASRGGTRRKVQGDMDVPLHFVQTSQPTGGRLHSRSSRACEASQEREREERLAGGARRWTRALGAPPPRLVMEWIAQADHAAASIGQARVPAEGTDEGAMEGGKEDEGTEQIVRAGRRGTARQKEKVRAQVIAQGMYAWFRQAFELQFNSGTQSPAVAFQRFLLRSTPIKGLGSATLDVADLRCLMLGIARQMGVMPHMPGPGLSYIFRGNLPKRPLAINGEWFLRHPPLGHLEGTVSIPGGAPSPLSRFPTAADHVNRRVLVSACYLAANGWKCLTLSRPAAPTPETVPIKGSWRVDEAWRLVERQVASEGNPSLWRWLPVAWEVFLSFFVCMQASK